MKSIGTLEPAPWTAGEAGAPPTAAAATMSPPIAAHPSGRILVVDDCSSIREALAKVLGLEGYEVLLADNGNRALELYTAGPMDLVILDLNLPERNGWDTLQRLLSLNTLQAIILITGERVDHRELFIGDSAVLMEKPLNLPVLLRSIATILGESTSVRQLRVEVLRSFTRLTRPCPIRFAHWPAYPPWGLNE